MPNQVQKFTKVHAAHWKKYDEHWWLLRIAKNNIYKGKFGIMKLVKTEDPKADKSKRME
jgi:hypothetical protein